MFFNPRSLIVTALVVAVVAVAFYDFYTKVEYSPIVETHSGKVKGFVSKSRLGSSFYSFLGIPYAEPPLGKYRFSNPQPVQPWSDIRQRTSFGSSCMQVDGLSRKVIGSEDCLFLNIFVPKNAFSNGTLLPVLLYIHGGYFMVGTSAYMGPEFLMDEQVVLITVNYRLNAFGFLNTEDDVVRGNMGLKDQNLALRWVVKNVNLFGGDGSRITLAGQSAGSVAVHLHTLSSMSIGLFSGAIMSSGTAIKQWSLVNNPKAQAENLGKQLNCPMDSSSDLVQCLRDANAFDIVDAQRDALSSPIMNALEIFAPSIENCKPTDPDCFLSTHPYDILKAGRSARVPILMGSNADEGLLATARMFFNESLQEDVNTKWNELSPNFFRYEKSNSDLTKTIRKFYIGDDPNKPLAFHEKFQNITNIFTDRLYIHASRETVKMQSKTSPIHLYYFTYPLSRGTIYLFDINPKLPIFPQFLWKEIRWFLNEHVFNVPNLFLGVGHGDDVILVFKFPVFNLSPKSKDYAMSIQMVKLWADFATNPKSLTFADKLWPPVTDATKMKYMLIGNSENHGSLIDEPFAQRMAFWDEVNLPWKL